MVGFRKPIGWRRYKAQTSLAYNQLGSHARPAREHASPGVLANILAMSGAHSNSMYVAAADRVGVERDQPFLGCSLIVSHTGFPLAGPASKTEEEIIYAELNLSDARRKRVLNNFNQPLRDRRIDLYDEMLGASIKRGWY